MLPQPLRGFFERFRAINAVLSRPARILVATTLGAVMLLAAWLAVRGAYEPYSVLFTQLDQEDAGAIVAKLKELKVPYRVTGEGGAIEVPEARVHELRLELAGAGLPRGGGVGFEGFDKMRLGATEFEQRVMYRRAMEGELARTIGSVAAVQSARVHLVLPEKSVFAARREPASASVVIKLRGSRGLGPSEVSGVVHLVAAAVPGLAPEHVALVTTDGTMLHRPKATSGDGTDAQSGGADPEQLSAARQIEVALEDRARAMLERLVGPGHVDVRVTAEVDEARIERTEDRFDPSKSALRSEEQTIERSAEQDDDSVAGVPGAESNLPTGSAPVPSSSAEAGKAAGNVLRESHTRNFEVDHIVEKRVLASGTLKRLAVAVVVDGAPGANGANVPRSREELEKIERVVRSAVGADDKRADLVTVESIPFLSTEPAPVVEAPEPSVMTRVPPVVRKWAPVAGAGVLGFLVLLSLLAARRKARRRAADRTRPPELAPVVEPPKLVSAEAIKNYREEAIRRAMDDPATAALVIRHWLGTAGDERAANATRAA